MVETNKEELLRILESRGQQFLSAFASPVVMGKRKVTSNGDTRKAKKQKANPESEEEWSGISSSSEDDHNNRSESESSGGPSPESSSPDLCLNNMLQRKIPQRVLRPRLKRMSLSSPKHSQ